MEHTVRVTELTSRGDPEMNMAWVVNNQVALVFLVIAGFGGMYLGRWRAESRRARHDMKNMWNRRKNYRNVRRSTGSSHEDPFH
jgi:hypothetical protein